MAWSTDAQLYQDPRSFEEMKDVVERRSKFRIEFDQYRLGCVLLEIGLWLLIRD